MKVALAGTEASFVINTLCAVQEFDGKLTKKARQRILQTIESVERKKRDGNRETLSWCLDEMEKAGTIIGQAMLRPDAIRSRSLLYWTLALLGAVLLVVVIRLLG